MVPLELYSLAHAEEQHTILFQDVFFGVYVGDPFICSQGTAGGSRVRIGGGLTKTQEIANILLEGSGGGMGRDREGG